MINGQTLPPADPVLSVHCRSRLSLKLLHRSILWQAIVYKYIVSDYLLGLFASRVLPRTRLQTHLSLEQGYILLIQKAPHSSTSSLHCSISLESLQRNILHLYHFSVLQLRIVSLCNRSVSQVGSCPSSEWPPFRFLPFLMCWCEQPPRPIFLKVFANHGDQA